MSDLYESYLRGIDNPSVSVLFLDLEAFEKNADWIAAHSGKKKIRIATKSIRSKEVLRKLLNHHEVFQGLMTYDLREALWLRQEGFTDILMGYPSLDMNSLEELARNPEGITLMVDRPEHLEIIERTAGEKKISVCIDIDLSMDLPGLRFGVYRSWINSPSRLAELIPKLKSCKKIKVTGLMGYEAQIAGVMDKESALIRFLKKRSIKQLQQRRKECVELLKKEGFPLELVNGGGTGSLSDTISEECVTEVTVGSGFYSPVLFDHYKSFRLNPSLMFTLPVIRNPEPGIYTCLGGGYIASGSVEKMKQPEPYLPEGLKLLKHEGAGEVQTPLQISGHSPLKIGDAVIMRHAKAGEICERFEKILLVRNGSNQGHVLTYRGEGKTFI